MRALLVTAVSAVLAAGCAGAPEPQVHRDVTASAPVKLTTVQACKRLLDDLTRNRGVPDILTLRLIADHVTAPRMAADARTAVRDIDHTGIAPVALGLLLDDCTRAGVHFPVPKTPSTPHT